MENNKKNILVLGASGEIGFAIYNHLLKSGFNCSGTSTTVNNSSRFIHYNLLDNVVEKINLKKFSHCIFCAAQTSISKFENDFDNSKIINIDRTIDAINKVIDSDIRIIFLSSAAVFKGELPFYSINHKPNPSTKYGESKLLIENYLLENHREMSAIIRLTKVISDKTPFIKEWETSAKSGKSIVAFCDKYLSPLNICDLVKVIETMIINDTFGLFQLGGKENLTYLQFCRKIFSKKTYFLHLVEPTYSNAKYPHASLETYLPKY